ncbi:MAG TPA: hypothetical protein PKM65_17005 [Spirochaetota bacterium]|nr:hypothetical protein [Spirochaetota bacterium]HNT12166.1 hypothetical protein [Spirochaetota bacterium]HNV45801.1 hypothetical protein [Spirochaetota bacterium]HOS40546.1 hypothetical protein [Spirochaetota bacterium]HPI23095.1 hypothetical protein [Spirochaetota bacterium]
MKVDTPKLQNLLSKYPTEFTCNYFSDVVVVGKKLKAGEAVLLFDVNNMVKSGIKDVEVVYDVTMYEYLCREYPSEYRRPVRWLSYFEIDKALEEIEKVNAQTKRKRFLVNIGDVYEKEAKGQKSGAILKHNEKLDYQKWKTVKMHINSEQKFFCRNSEHGIILFMSMKSEGGADYVDKFSKQADLIAAMVSRRTDKNEIAPDFVPTEDVHPVTVPGQLLEEYIRTNARLIIIGENITGPFKEALLQVKSYDPFVRMMVAPPYDPKTVDHFLQQVKIVYNADRWKK